MPDIFGRNEGQASPFVEVQELDYRGEVKAAGCQKMVLEWSSLFQDRLKRISAVSTMAPAGGSLNAELFVEHRSHNEDAFDKGVTSKWRYRWARTRRLKVSCIRSTMHDRKTSEQSCAILCCQLSEFCRMRLAAAIFPSIMPLSSLR